MNRRWPSPTLAASSGSSSRVRIALARARRIVFGDPHDVLPRTQLEPGEVVFPHDRHDRDAGGHHLEARGAEPEVVEVVALDVGRGDVRRHDVLRVPRRSRSTLLAHAELVGDLQERVVEHVADDDHDDVVALLDEIGERAHRARRGRVWSGITWPTDKIIGRSPMLERLARGGAVETDESARGRHRRRCASGDRRGGGSASGRSRR